MVRIEIGETCIGCDVVVDGESIFPSEYDERSEEHIRQLKLKLINELPSVVDQISSYDLQQIANIIVINGYDWEYDTENSSKSICNQCGNYNINEIYNKIK